MMPTICLVPGDGIGQEVIPETARVLAALCPDMRFTLAQAGWEVFLRTGSALPEATVHAVAQADATLFGAIQSPTDGRVTPYRSPILDLRQRFDLYANLRPARGLLPEHPPIDLLIVRENSEGLYVREEESDGETAVARRRITWRASLRIARVAFWHARARGGREGRPPLVTIVHKANVLPRTDGLFRAAAREAAEDFPDVQVEEMLVDAAAMKLVQDPARFDVILAPNLYGDILSDLAAGLAGGLGLAPSANLGDGPVALFEPVHGSAPDIAGRGVANPVAALLSGAMALERLGRAEEATRLRNAIHAVLYAGVRPPDLGGDATTVQFAEAVIHAL
ncbi:MAG TPA: isocitrate/isopropylmalate dehydrogenase family protein [Caldilineae bacterium]|nr:isocitrate/isopropylmalate dehydrogenase family protein [Caldilineae bacterium]